MNKQKSSDSVHLRQYRIIEKMGKGSYGDIFLAENEDEGQHVALKLEPVSARNPYLKFEYQLYKYLSPQTGIPRVYSYFTDFNYNVMAMDLLGPSLEDLFNFCSRRFSLKTVLMLAAQMIDRVSYVHSQHFVHRDIKPDNFAMGIGADRLTLFIIDFGLAKKFYDPVLKAHIPMRWNGRMTGTARYASINALLGFEISRRDDMQSLGYVWMYFLLGALPWQGLMGPKHQRHEMLAEKKNSIRLEELCKGYPDEFAQYMHHCRYLCFDEEPKYLVIRRSFSDLFTRLRYVQDNVYDWHILRKAELEDSDSSKEDE